MLPERCHAGSVDVALTASAVILLAAAHRLADRTDVVAVADSTTALEVAKLDPQALPHDPELCRAQLDKLSACQVVETNIIVHDQHLEDFEVVDVVRVQGEVDIARSALLVRDLAPIVRMRLKTHLAQELPKRKRLSIPVSIQVDHALQVHEVDVVRLLSALDQIVVMVRGDVSQLCHEPTSNTAATVQRDHSEVAERQVVHAQRVLHPTNNLVALVAHERALVLTKKRASREHGFKVRPKHVLEMRSLVHTQLQRKRLSPLQPFDSHRNLPSWLHPTIGEFRAFVKACRHK